MSKPNEPLFQGQIGPGFQAKLAWIFMPNWPGFQARLAHIFQASLTRIFHPRLAGIFQARLTGIFQARLAEIFQARLARIFQARLARIFKARDARFAWNFQARLAPIFQARFAQIFQARFAQIFQARLARISRQDSPEFLGEAIYQGTSEDSEGVRNNNKKKMKMKDVARYFGLKKSLLLVSFYIRAGPANNFYPYRIIWYLYPCRTFKNGSNSLGIGQKSYFRILFRGHILPPEICPGCDKPYI